MCNTKNLIVSVMAPSIMYAHMYTFPGRMPDVIEASKSATLNVTCTKSKECLLQNLHQRSTNYMAMLSWPVYVVTCRTTSSQVDTKITLKQPGNILFIDVSASRGKPSSGLTSGAGRQHVKACPGSGSQSWWRLTEHDHRQTEGWMDRQTDKRDQSHYQPLCYGWRLIISFTKQILDNKLYILRTNAKSFLSASCMMVDPVSAEWAMAATLAPRGTDADALYNNDTEKWRLLTQSATSQCKDMKPLKHTKNCPNTRLLHL